ncbi:ABC transporter ATP-binding protein [uncultured Enterovirga sp.]|uniref:ABC transporter ATP-binding protein n=1 Tax=uncultured Enterovirga sp. TaxID=2026352 RepID=UPI0035CAD588
MTGISISGVSKSFGSTPVLRDVSLEVADGEFLTLVGPSGCGKSTLLRILAGLDFADSGRVSIGGRPVDDLAPKRRDVAMVFQSYALYPYMTVAQNIALPLEMRRLSAAQRLPLVGRFWPGARAARQAIASETSETAASLGLGGLLDRRPAQLSGGQRQRVALARAMVRHPQVFLMDEPLSNLDAKLRVQARAEIAELHRRLGVTFIYVTHDQSEAMTLSDRVAVMANGRILQLAAPQTVYDDPENVEVARFIGTPEMNLLPATVSANGMVECAGAVLPVSVDAPRGAALEIGIRPEAWRVFEQGDPGRRGPALAGRIRRLEHLGSDTLLHVGVPGIEAPVVARVPPSFEGVADDLVALAPPSNRILAFGSDGRRIAIRAATSASAVRSLELAGG